MEKYIKIKRNDYIVDRNYYKVCEGFKIPYCAIQDLNKWSYIRVDLEPLGIEVYDKINDYLKENYVEELDNIHHRIASFLNYSSVDEMDQLYCISSFIAV